MKKALIIGAGPAGLTAAYELLKGSDDIEVIVFEESEYMGGISKTVNYNGNRMDMGGHRFFSKVPESTSGGKTCFPCRVLLPMTTSRWSVPCPGSRAVLIPNRQTA